MTYFELLNPLYGKDSVFTVGIPRFPPVKVVRCHRTDEQTSLVLEG